MVLLCFDMFFRKDVCPLPPPTLTTTHPCTHPQANAPCCSFLQAFEARLLKLEGFLKDYQQRRRNRASNARAGPAFGGEPSASGRGGFSEYPQTSTPGYSGMPPSKKPRLAEAARQEDQRRVFCTPRRGCRPAVKFLGLVAALGVSPCSTFGFFESGIWCKKLIKKAHIKREGVG